LRTGHPITRSTVYVEGSRAGNDWRDDTDGTA
jgi:hypothetical protein